jgi:hypothetical protein
VPAPDFFIFFFSADLGAMIEYDDLRQRINPLFREQYLPVFGVLLTLSVLFLVVSGLTQRKLETWREHEWNKTSFRYRPSSSAVKCPIVSVIACWVATVALMPLHLFVFFGKA